MRFESFTKLFGMMCVALIVASSVQAATVQVPITDLYNTGMSTPWNTPQVPLSGSDPGSAVDPYWSVTHDPAGMPPLGLYGTTTLGDPALYNGTGVTAPFAGNQFGRHQYDLAHDAQRADTFLDDSQWISSVMPASNGNQVYIFETTFTTTQLASPISISGFFKAGDVLGIQLNGDAIVDPDGPVVFGATRPISPSHGFTVTGTGGLTNTLRFYVNRPGGNPSYLRVQFSNATFTVPEPSTIVLGALGLVGFGVTRLRRRFVGGAKAS